MPSSSASCARAGPPTPMCLGVNLCATSGAETGAAGSTESSIAGLARSGAAGDPAPPGARLGAAAPKRLSVRGEEPIGLGDPSPTCMASASPGGAPAWGGWLPPRAPGTLDTLGDPAALPTLGDSGRSEAPGDSGPKDNLEEASALRDFRELARTEPLGEAARLLRAAASAPASPALRRKRGV